jgi:hypothetical protein
MSFIKVPGLKGRLYVQEEEKDAPRKHHCPDCAVCQLCSDARCRACLEQKGSKEKECPKGEK